MSKMRFFALQELSNRKPLEVIAPSNKLSDYYGSHVFDRKKMQEYLPKEAYKAVTDAIEKGTPISREIADLIANGMKSWAKSLNVTPGGRIGVSLLTGAKFGDRMKKNIFGVFCD